ncbi:hypothetical protein [Thiohalorhabdus sp.]|uniref:hypothetical protein n=1 Tax=Thiohalorhabdus sp. TaxID=3094134 RepID=UPI002FC2F965
MSGPPQVLLHIGLHKTGTRFLQREVFGQLDPARFNVNPEPLWPALRQAVRHPDDPGRVARARDAVADWRASGDERTLVVSEPHISGDMYGSHHDYADNLALVRELFPEARVIFFVRRQSDWLQSAYRQHLAKGKAVPIEAFLNFYDGEFRPRVAREVYGARNVEALSLRFLAIYRAYADAFGDDAVFLLRQEDLRARPAAVKALIADALGLATLPDPPPSRGHNRSYSALAIHLFHPGVWRRYPAPGPGDAHGRRIPQWLNDLLGPLRRLRRGFIQHVFDRVLYYDWDLLARHGMRERIEAHYAEENAELERIARRQLAVVARSEEAVEGSAASGEDR